MTENNLPHLHAPADEIEFVAPDYKTPGSRLVLRADAPRAEWLAARLEGIGGSEASAILGLNKYASAFGIWLEKTGQHSEDVAQNEAMYWGSAMEPILRKRFVEDTGIRVRSAGLHRSKEYPFMQVTVDGLTEDGGIFESKTASSFAAGDDWDDDGIPDHAAIQVQHGLAVTGRSHAWIVGLLDGRGWQLRGPIPRNEALIETIIAAEQEFWLENVQKMIAPPVTAISLDEVKSWLNASDESKVARIPRAELAPLRSQLESYKALAKTATDDAKRIEAEIRLLIGDAELVAEPGEDFNYATLKHTATFSSTKFKEEHPDLAAKYTVDKPVLDAKALAAAEPSLYSSYRGRVLRFAAAPKTKTTK